MKPGRSFIVLLLLTSTVAVAQSTPAERTLFDSVNHDRKVHNLPALRLDESLATAARKHAHEMAKRGTVEHTFPGEPSLPARANKAGARFISISENVVRAANARSAHSEFMNSPRHKGNILDSDSDSVGIGAVEHSGELFVVEDFSKAKK